MRKIIAILLCINITIAPLYASLIEDDFVNSTIDKNLKIKDYQYTPIVDDFVMLNKTKNPPKTIVAFDEIIPKMPKQKFVRKLVILDDNYQELKVRIKDFYSTKNKMQEGEVLEFFTLNDIKIKNKNYPKNSIVKARIETISLNKSYGIPSDVIIGNFMLENNPLAGEVTKIGANRALWLRPAVDIASCFFGLGLLLIPIRGGHAKIKTDEIFTLYVN